MKKSICLTLFLCVAYLSTLFAHPLPEGDIITRARMVKDKVMVLTLANLQQKDASIVLTDYKEELIYFTKNVRKHNGFSHRLNFKKLPVGKYLITIRTNGRTYRQIISVKEERILLSSIKGV